MSTIALTRSPSPRSPTPPPPPVSSPPRDESPQPTVGPIEDPATMSYVFSEDEVAAAMMPVEDDLLDDDAYQASRRGPYKPQPKPKRVRQSRRLAQVPQGRPPWIIRQPEDRQEGGVVRTQRPIPTRGPAVQGMRLGFHCYTPEQKHWIQMHIQETQDYCNTHSDLNPFYLDIWRRFSNEYPSVYCPPFPEDADMVHAYNLSKGKSLTKVLRHTWSFRNFGRLHREETPEWGAGAIAGSGPST
ncbi:hypothetical protein BDZ89DRAFT_1149691 [Hymenopellis radicata]|nr:hypothetical protein BDZ89DRAFT_1149691 [Hymenopellis radicata]